MFWILRASTAQLFIMAPIILHLFGVKKNSKEKKKEEA